MIAFNDLIKKAIENGYNEISASAKVAQDIVLLMISKTEYNNNITLKGGVLMRNISNDIRRATKDLDIDLIRYSLDDAALIKLIERFDGIEGIKVKISGKIKELKQQDYKGKRVPLELIDFENQKLQTKIDFGVHTYLSIKQMDYCIDIGLGDNGVVILANSVEQMFTEKLCSLLRHRIATTRYKDIFDIYYLIGYVDKKRLSDIIDKMVIRNELINESSLEQVLFSLEEIFSDKGFIDLLKQSKDNWVEKDVEDVVSSILSFMNGIL